VCARSMRLLAAVLLAMGAAPAGALAQERIGATVSRVTDGDTLVATLASGAEQTVRLIGIDAPESVNPESPVECGAREAGDRLADLVEGRAVLLTTDPTQDRLDRFGRLLAYVNRGGVDAGLEMVRGGHAAVFVFARPFQRLPAYRDAAESARTARRAVWGACGGNFHAPAGRPGDEGASRQESAERFVRRYYFLLNQRRFSTAWTKFSSAQRQRLGPFAGWRSGFRRTLGTRVNSVSVGLAGARAIVRVAIRARDRDACSGRLVEQFFRVRWVLARRGESWVATGVSARKVGGGTVRLQRSQCAPSRPSAPTRPDRPSPGGGRSCDPNYTGCLDPNASDYDCAGGSGEGPRYTGPVRVRGDDHFDLDRDGDGLACEDS
jgi:endonuclease YncB( thermonuclease family)